MSFMKKLAELVKKQNQDKQPLQPPINDRDITQPPRQDNRVMADQGIGGYLNPNQLEMFTNPPVPNNQAGLMDMARLLQQQQDTFGNMLTYTSPPSDDGTGGGTGGGGTGGGGTGGGTGGGGDIIDIPDERDQLDILDEIRRRRRELPPQDFRFPFEGIGGIPVNIPGLPPMVPPRDEQIFVPPRNLADLDTPRIPPMIPPRIPPMIPPRELPPSRDSFDYGYGPGIMPPLPDDFMIENRTDIPPRTAGISSIPANNNVPVPRLPTGMETLVSPDIFINRNKRRMLS